MFTELTYFIIALIFWSQAGLVSANHNGELIKYVLHSESELWLNGTSTINRFQFKTKQIKGEGQIRPQVYNDSNSQNSPNLSVTVAIPITSLESGNKQMNKDMYQALKAEHQSDILYTLKQAQLTKHPQKHDGWFAISTTGWLVIAGQKKEVNIKVQLRVRDSGRFQLKGNTMLLMSDFEINPPSALGGLIKAKDSISISFNLIAIEENLSIHKENN